MIPPAHAPIPLEIIRIIVQLSSDPERRPMLYTCSGFFQSGPISPCFTRAQMNVAIAAIVTITEDAMAGMRYLPYS